MLDEFSSTKLDDKPAPSQQQSIPKPGSSGPGRPGISANPDVPSKEEDDFAHQLQAGMAEMLKEIEENPDMAKQFQEMMAQFGVPPSALEEQSNTKAEKATPKTPAAPAQASPAREATSTSTKNAQADTDFQSTIRKTMERMKASSDSATAANNDDNPFSDDMMASLLRQMQDAGGPDGDGDDTFSKMLLGMMEQLTNKEILYEPMKELDQKFPKWLEEKQGKLSKEDEERYRTQRGLVREIVSRFERKGYSDGNPEDREFIVERMQKVSMTECAELSLVADISQMQEAGAPPPDLVGDVNAASEMMGDLDAGCPQQ